MHVRCVLNICLVYASVWSYMFCSWFVLSELFSDSPKEEGCYSDFTALFGFGSCDLCWVFRPRVRVSSIIVGVLVSLIWVLFTQLPWVLGISYILSLPCYSDVCWWFRIWMIFWFILWFRLGLSWIDWWRSSLWLMLIGFITCFDHMIFDLIDHVMLSSPPIMAWDFQVSMLFCFEWFRNLSRVPGLVWVESIWSGGAACLLSILIGVMWFDSTTLFC